MAKRGGARQALYDEPLALLRWKYSAERQRASDEWNRRHQNDIPPSPHVKRIFCKLLIDNPFLIGEPFDRYILPLLREWWANAKPPKRRFSAQDVAAVVDDLVIAGMQLTKARRKVAEWLGKEFSAVERDHQRHGIRKRGKSR